MTMVMSMAVAPVRMVVAAAASVVVCVAGRALAAMIMTVILSLQGRARRVGRSVPDDLVPEGGNPLGQGGRCDRVVMGNRHGPGRNRDGHLGDAGRAPQGRVDLGRTGGAIHARHPIAGPQFL
jgi:hypothetical protein